MTKFRLNSDAPQDAGQSGWFPAFNIPDDVNANVLAADTSENAKISANAALIMLVCAADFWYNKNAAAAIPSADITNGTGSQLCPAGIMLFLSMDDITTLGLISATDGAVVSVSNWT